MSMKWQRSTIKDGALHLDGSPVFLLSADYPYYRDHKEDWEMQLTRIKECGVKYVTFYLPWRHHMPEDPMSGQVKYDFAGKTQPNRDVKYLLELCQKLGLLVVAKPGPFVHAELNYGGLPDYVEPGETTGIEPITNNKGAARTWTNVKEQALPAPLDPKYLKYVKIWLETVAREILKPYQYPAGPIIAVQILNEGIYSDAGHEINAYDYSKSSLHEWRKFLKKKYKTAGRLSQVYGRDYSSFNDVEFPREWQGVRRRRAILPYMDWGEYVGTFIPLIVKKYKSFMKGIQVPYLTNFNPPGTDAAHQEAYFAKNNQRLMDKEAHYGFTNWLGVIYDKWEDYCRYRQMATRSRGICLEENWGFSKIYDPAYEFCQPSYFQSMAYIAFGATGLNIYTMAATDGWNEQLDRGHLPPYPHHPPIAEDGSVRPKYWTLYQMASFLNREGVNLTRKKKRAQIAWGLYTPYSQAAAWQQDPGEWQKAGFSDVCRGVAYGWDPFLRMLAKSDTESDLAYLKEDKLSDLLKYKMIFTNGFDWMDGATQRKLVDYIRKGGTLVMTGTVPYLNEDMLPCRTLQYNIFSAQVNKIGLTKALAVTLDRLRFNCLVLGTVLQTELGEEHKPLAHAFYNDKKIDCGYVVAKGKGRGVFLGFIPWLTAENVWENEGLVEYLLERFKVTPNSRAFNCALSPRVDVTQYDDKSAGKQYLFILTRDSFPVSRLIRYTDEHDQAQYFTVELCANTAAVVGIKKGRINSALLKCTNDHRRSSTKPRLVLGDRALAASLGCDLALVEQQGYYELTLTNIISGDTAEVMIPLSAEEVKSVVAIDAAGQVGISFSPQGKNIKFTAGDLARNFQRYLIYLK